MGPSCASLFFSQSDGDHTLRLEVMLRGAHQVLELTIKLAMPMRKGLGSAEWLRIESLPAE